MIKRTLLLLHALLLAVLTNAQPAAEAPLPFHPEMRQGALDNGLQYFIMPHAEPEGRAELRLALRAGSLQEDPDQLGLAHFIEHMAFNGTEHFAKNELIDYLESTGMRFGADLNAYTSFEQTVYLLQVRTDSLPELETGLLILQDWASGLSFDTTEIDKERGVVISEWRSSLSASQRLQQKYLPVLYQDSRYAERLPIGDPELIKTADYATIRRFYNDWYRPDLMAVVAVGDFDPEWMEQEIKTRFGRLENPPAPRPRRNYPMPGHDSTLFAIHTDPEAAFTRVQVIFKHPGESLPVATRKDARKQLIHSLYNGMLNSRLFEVQQQADPPFTFAYSGYGSNVGHLATYATYAFTQKGGAGRGIEAVLRETMRARQHGFTATELERQKKEILRAVEKAAREQDKIKSERLADRAVRFFIEKTPLMSARQRLELYRELLPTITLQEINPLPRQWLTPDNRVVIVTGPEDPDAPLPSRAEMQALLDRLKNLELPPYEDEVTDAPLLAEIPAPTPVVSVEKTPSLGLEEWELPNGLTVVLKPTDFKNDEILMTAFSPGGHSLYSEEDYFSTGAAARLVDLGGLGAFNLTSLQKKLAGKNVSAGPYIDELYEGINGNCAPEDLETLLKLTYLYFTQPRKDSTALLSYLSRQRSIFENLTADPYYYFAEVKSAIKYDNHPRRRLTQPEDLERISLDRAYDIYQERFANAGDFTFFFVGNFEPDAIRPLITAYLGNLPAKKRTENWRDVGADLIPGPLDTTIVRGQAPKAILEMVYHGDFDYDRRKNRYHFYSLVELLRQNLRERLREDEGGVYGVRISGFAAPYPDPRYRLTISFNADPERMDSLLAATREEIEKIKKTGADAATLKKIKEIQLEDRTQNLRENGFWLGQLAARYRNEVPLESIQLENYQTLVEGLSGEDLKKAAAMYLKEESKLQLVLRPAGE